LCVSFIGSEHIDHRHYGLNDDEDDEDDEYDEGSSCEEEDFETETLDVMERVDIYHHDEQDNY
jgi:hypothetical protein